MAGEIGNAFHAADQQLARRASLENLRAALRELRAYEALQRARYHRLVAEGIWGESSRQYVLALERTCRRSWFAWVKALRPRIRPEAELPPAEESPTIPAMDFSAVVNPDVVKPPAVVNPDVVKPPAVVNPDVVKRKEKWAGQPTLFDLW